MKDSQFGPPTQKTWNGGVMSGASSGGGRRADGGGQRAQNQGGSGYPHWPPHPMHHHMQSQHTQLPRMMGGYYGGRGLPPATAHFASGSWGRPSGGTGQSSGLKPPDRWAPSGGSQQVEGGMDLSQSRPNGSQPNGVAKEAVSVIAANPLRSAEKPLEPSDRSEDEDEDCMVIEEGEEAPHSGELPPRQSAQTRAEEDVRQRLDMSRHEPPAAHLNPLRQPSLPIGSSGRPEVSHHLPPSVAQPLRSTDSAPLQMLQKSSQLLQGLPSSSPLQKLSRLESTSPLPKPGSPHLPASPLGQKSPSPSLLAQQQQVLHQFAQQILVQKQIQDTQQQQLLAAAQHKLPEAAFQQLLVQQKLLSTNTSASVEAAHQMILGQQMSQLAARQQEISKTSHIKAKSSSPAHTPSANPPHFRTGVQGGSSSSHYSPRESSVHTPIQPESLPVPLQVKQRHESANLPPLPINIPSSLQVIPHPKNSSSQQVEDRLEVSQSGRSEASYPQPDEGRVEQPDPLPPQLHDRLETAKHVSRPDIVPELNEPRLEPSEPKLEPSEPRLDPNEPRLDPNEPRLDPNEPRISETAIAPACSTPALPCPAATSQSDEGISEAKPCEASSEETGSLEPSQSSHTSNITSNTEQPLPDQSLIDQCSSDQPSTDQPSTYKSLPDEQTSQQNQVERVSSESEKPLEPKKEILATVDHVESMLENLFQQDNASTPTTAKPLSISDRKSPALTEDKVVQILLDKEEDIKTDVKPEIITEVKIEPSTPQKFMQVESELEKMFAGIMETPGDSDTKPETPESSSALKSNAKKRGRRPRSKKDSIGSSSKKKRSKSPHSAESIRLKRRFGPKAEKIKEGSNDSSSISTADRQIYKSRGPCIKVVGGKDGTPSSVTIVNSSASNEDDRDKIIEKSIKRKPRIIEGRTKGPGLYSSTLSSKYNSTTIDVTWTCIFCNKRSHCEGGLGGEPAGDLFGPYLVHIKVEPVSGCPSDVDIVNEQRKRGGGKQLSLRAGGKANHSFSPPHKKSRKSSTSDKESIVVEGNASCSSSSSNTISKEVWIHEACAIWAPGVILVGPHLIGLDDAVSLSLHSKCGVCGDTGACISCLQHGCHLVCHYGCARATKWSLDEQTFHARCFHHKKPISISQALQQSAA